MKASIVAAMCIGLSATSLTAQSRLDAADATLLQAGFAVTAEAFIVPAHRDWADAAQDTAAALGRYCAGAGTLAPVHDGYARTFLGWQRASVVQLGPLMDIGGPLMVQLWPDSKGYSRRAVHAAVQAEDPALLDAGALADQSIAVSNLAALEIVLYGDLPAGSYACDLARAIAEHQAKLAHVIQEGWEPGSAFRTDYDTAAAGNARYPDLDALIRELLASVVVHVDRLRKFKILRGLGPEPGDPHPERTEAKLSGLGLASIQSSFQALADLYNLPYGFFDVTPDMGGSMDYVLLGETAANTASALAQESRTFAEIVAEDGDMAREIRGFGELTLFHEDYLKTSLPRSIGVLAGFTSADGD